MFELYFFVVCITVTNLHSPLFSKHVEIVEHKCCAVFLDTTFQNKSRAAGTVRHGVNYDRFIDKIWSHLNVWDPVIQETFFKLAIPKKMYCCDTILVYVHMQ